MIQKKVKFIAGALICLCYFLPAEAFKLRNPVQTRAVASFSTLIPQAQFNKLFPLRDKFFTYPSFLKAVQNLAQVKVRIEKRGPFIYKITRSDKRTGKETVVRQDKDWNESWAQQKEYSSVTIDYGLFCNNQDLKTNQKELAAFFAQVAHETRNGRDGQFNDGLMLKRELDTVKNYVVNNVIYPALPGKKYYGRGPLQLSYNGNYGFASDCIYGDKNKLLSDPDLLLKDPVVSFETAIYFWMTPQGIKPAAHDVINGKWKPTAAEQAKGWSAGFGLITNIINGAIECNKGETVAPMKNRMAYYQYYLRAFGLTDTKNCSCGSMQPFP
ncbi:chitinase [Pedobacter cryoconitis]|uniref:Glycoside hydrolase family 19 catalytic domain-containing protein n=1 Tax=Pedobacter cryoconitis TaxID=188932 RepID=A0A7X0J6P6_9SPHI|nr:chitinase [Pedobacter cryoconitis]MBB6501322.1 hypothetical protein [Pedobacter cryoconitis]